LINERLTFRANFCAEMNQYYSVNSVRNQVLLNRQKNTNSNRQQQTMM